MNNSKMTCRMMSGKRYLVRYIFSFLMMGLALNAYSQNEYELNGCVKGMDNEPLGNVTISVLGSNQKPAVTDEDGNYTISVPSGDVWVSFQPIGRWESKSVFLDKRKKLNVYLAREDYTSYNSKVNGEAVDKLSRDVITAHQHITSEQMKYSGNVTVDQFFQTQLTGALVSNLSSMPGAGTSTFLRGINTLNTTNEPLYVVDGVPLERSSLYESYFEGYQYNPLSSIDPFDVTSITVYKDPSYATKYGVYGANGVVEINTISPDASTTVIDVKYRTGVDLKQDYLPQLQSSQYKSLANELLYSSGIVQEEYAQQYAGLYYTPDDTLNYLPYSHNTNWQDEVFQNAIMQNVYFSIKGGDAIAKYGISVGYLTKDGTIKNTSYDRFNARFAGNFNIVPRIKMALNVNLVNTNMSLRESALSPVTSPIISGLWKSPMLSPYAYDDNGTQLKTAAALNALGVSNPLALNQGFTGENSDVRFSSSAKLIGEITEKIDIVTQLSVNYNSMTENSFSPDRGMAAYANGEATNEVQGFINTFWGIYSNTYLKYADVFGKKRQHNISSMLGMRYTNLKFQNDLAATANTPSDAYTSLGPGEDLYNFVGGDNVNYAWLSFNGALNYNYKQKYYVDVNVTSDASTSIGQQASTPYTMGDVPMSLFYSVGAAWRLSNTMLLKNVDFIEDLKLRASYGTAGNDDFDVLASQPNSQTDHFNKLGVAVPGPFANTALKYETTQTFNGGLDFVLKGGRHQIIFDAYKSIVDDMLVYTPLPNFVGESYFPSNTGKVSTLGYELTLNTRVIDHRDFAFDLGVKLGSYTTEILELPGDQIVRDLPGLGQVISRKGDQLTEFYGYQYNGVYSTTQQSMADNKVNAKGIAYRAGDANFSDISGEQGVSDGVVNNYDKVSLGSSVPTMVGIFSAQITYKRWLLRGVSQLMTGQEVFNYVRYENEKMEDLTNQSVKVLQRWTHEGQETTVPQATWGDPVGNSDFSSRWIEDGSYFRLKEVTLAYRVNKPFLFFKKLEAYVTAENVLTLTNYNGYDPEMSYSYDPILQGIDYGAMPQTRSFIFGINLGL